MHSSTRGRIKYYLTKFVTLFGKDTIQEGNKAQELNSIYANPKHESEFDNMTMVRLSVGISGPSCSMQHFGCINVQL